MKKPRFNEQQVASILKQVEDGTPVEEACRHADISIQTYYRWRCKYGGLEPQEMKRLKVLEDENARLKRLVTKQSLQSTLIEPVSAPAKDAENLIQRRFCLRTAKHLHRLRRERDEVFGEDASLFGEPAWEILLKLYIAFGERKRLMRTEASMIEFIPQSTGLRTLSELEARGLVRSEQASGDRRIGLASLSELGVTLMEGCLSRMVEPRRRSGDRQSEA